jgi:hypothetical protein
VWNVPARGEVSPKAEDLAAAGGESRSDNGRRKFVNNFKKYVTFLRVNRLIYVER